MSSAANFVFACDEWMDVCVWLCATSHTRALFYIQTHHLVLMLGLWTGVREGQQVEHIEIGDEKRLISWMDEHAFVVLEPAKPK